MNNSISYTSLRDKLKITFDEVCNNHIPMLVTRKNGKEVVIVAKEDYESLEETAYLLRSPENARILLESLNNKNTKEFSNLSELKNAFNI